MAVYGAGADVPAAMSPGSEVVGADRFHSTLTAAADQLAHLDDAAAAAADLVCGASAAAAPYRTGALRASHRGEAADGVAVITAAVPYAGPLHWGWLQRGITGRRWMTSAAARLEPRWTALFDEQVQAVVDTVQGA